MQLHSPTHCTFMHHGLPLWHPRFQFFMYLLNYCSYLHISTHSEKDGGLWYAFLLKNIANLSQTYNHHHGYSNQINSYTQTPTHTQSSVAPCRKRFCFVACYTIVAGSDLTGLKRDALIFWRFSLNKLLERGRKYTLLVWVFFFSLKVKTKVKETQTF